jgi:hypothetical protein
MKGRLLRGSVRKPCGVDPPDDIRHRMLRWDMEREMWGQTENRTAESRI